MNNRCGVGSRCRYGSDTSLSLPSCSGPCQQGYFCSAGSTTATSEQFALGLAAAASVPPAQTVAPPTQQTTTTGSGSDTAAPATEAMTLFGDLARIRITSGHPIEPPLTLVLNPPSPQPVSCEVFSTTPSTVVRHGTAVLQSNATLRDLTITAQPGTTADLTVRRRPRVAVSCLCARSLPVDTALCVCVCVCVCVSPASASLSPWHRGSGHPNHRDHARVCCRRDPTGRHLHVCGV